MSPPADTTRRRYAARLPREERRELVLDAALRVITRDGFAAATIANVAAEAEIAKSVLYGIFGDAETLQHDLMVREQEQSFAVAARAVEAAGAADALNALRESLLVFLDGVAEAPDAWRLVVMPTAGLPPKVARAIADGRERWRRALMPVVAAHFDTLGVAGADADLAAHLVRGNAEYLARLLIEDPEHFTRERVAAFVAGLTTALAAFVGDA